MATEPNTTIKIMSDIPFDVDYRHTLYFGNSAAQSTYMASKVKYTLSNQSYQRLSKNRIRVEKNADDLRDCNYLQIQNTAHSSRNFYAFILNVEYINENTAEIEYKIDVLQSYLFAWDNTAPLVTIGDSFIEREHSATDNIGDNIVPEDLTLGEMVFNGYDRVDSDLTAVYAIVAICNVKEHSQGTYYNGIYGGCTLYAFNLPAEITAINDLIDSYVLGTGQITADEAAVNAIYIAPKKVVDIYYDVDADHKIVVKSQYIGSANLASTWIKTLPSVSGTDTLGGYTPKNKKLYTYPYNYLHVDNGDGEALSLRYEFFSSGIPNLLIKGVFTQPVSLSLTPTHYKGVAPDIHDLAPYYDSVLTETLTLNNFPLCSWNYDSFSAWAAQNQLPMLFNAISGIGSSVIGAAVSRVPAASAGMGIIGNICSALSRAYSASIKADVCRGKANNAGGGVSYHTQEYFYGRCSVNAKDAEIIDNFFSTYGYATNKVKKPNVFGATVGKRPYWNYVKTMGANVYGKASAAILKEISSIFDNGITFFMQGAYYGDYSQNNAVSL